ncbi:MAG: hypothetical protein M3N95_02840 [Actinomycetota bacterium]|nr:hypothetical protein [Actinomycetota bacterium]
MSATSHRQGSGDNGYSSRLLALRNTLTSVGRGTPRGRAGVLFAAIVGMLGGAGLAARLFVGGAIGVSDQGDGTRLLCSLGLREGNRYNTSTTQFLYLTWYNHQWYGETCGATGSGEPYNSSQLWFLRIAKWLTPILGLPGGLDLRALGAVFCVLVAVICALFAWLLPGTGLARVLGVGMLWLVIADGAFAGYFVSAYSEPAALVGILLLAIGVIVFWRTRTLQWWAVLLVCAAAVLTITAKTQSASLLVTLIPLILCRPSFGGSIQQRLDKGGLFAIVTTRRRVAAFIVTRWPTLIVCALLVVITQQYLADQPKRFEVQNRYAAVFIEMLPHSPNPAADLKHLGLPVSMASSSGVPINAPGSVASTPAFVGFVNKTSPLRTTEIYLLDPVRLAGMAGRGLKGMGVLRADYVYSYPQSAHLPPDTEECRVCVVQSVWKTVFGGAPAMIVIFGLLSFGVCLYLLATRRDRRSTAIAVAGIFAGLSAVAQFWVVMLTEGASDLIKHMVLANYMTALTFVIAGYCFYLIRTTTNERQPSGELPLPPRSKSVQDDAADPDATRGAEPR